MLVRIAKLFLYLLESYIFVVASALVIGLLFADHVSILTRYTTIFLQIIFFLSSLKLDPRNLIKETRDIKTILAANAFMLLILPAVVYLIAAPLLPTLAIPLLLLAAMPSGMTTPLLAEVIGGKQGIALAITITSSLLAPLTIPLVIQVFARTAVSVDAFDMFFKLLAVIVLPFAVAQLVRFFFHRKLQVTYFTFKPISIALLGLLIAGAVAKQAPVILANLNTSMLLKLTLLFVFLTVLFVVGYYVAFWKKHAERVTIAVSVTFLNFTLAIYLASTFFDDPDVVLMSVLVIFPWVLMLLPFKVAVQFLAPKKTHARA